MFYFYLISASRFRKTMRPTAINTRTKLVVSKNFRNVLHYINRTDEKGYKHHKVNLGHSYFSVRSMNYLTGFGIL